MTSRTLVHKDVRRLAKAVQRAKPWLRYSRALEIVRSAVPTTFTRFVRGESMLVLDGITAVDAEAKRIVETT